MFPRKQRLYYSTMIVSTVIKMNVLLPKLYLPQDDDDQVKMKNYP